MNLNRAHQEARGGAEASGEDGGSAGVSRLQAMQQGKGQCGEEEKEEAEERSRKGRILRERKTDWCKRIKTESSRS